MAGTLPLTVGPVSGLAGFAAYQQWVRRRPSHAPSVTCELTGPVLVLGNLSNDRRDLSWETRARLVHFEHLDRLYPEASVPRTPVEWLEFEQRCWCLGITIGQGCTLRSVNRRQSLLWP